MGCSNFSTYFKEGGGVGRFERKASCRQRNKEEKRGKRKKNLYRFNAVAMMATCQDFAKNKENMCHFTSFPPKHAF